MSGSARQNPHVAMKGECVAPSLKDEIGTSKTPYHFEGSNSPIPVSTRGTANDKILVTTKGIIVLSCLHEFDGVPCHHREEYHVNFYIQKQTKINKQMEAPCHREIQPYTFYFET